MRFGSKILIKKVALLKSDRVVERALGPERGAAVGTSDSASGANLVNNVRRVHLHCLAELADLDAKLLHHRNTRRIVPETDVRGGGDDHDMRVHGAKERRFIVVHDESVDEIEVREELRTLVLQTMRATEPLTRRTIASLSTPTTRKSPCWRASNMYSVWPGCRMSQTTVVRTSF